MTTSLLLELRDVSLAFGGVRALNGATFGLHAGELTALIGPNGAGKTSLLNCINGFYRPQSGSARFAGNDLMGMRAYAIAELGVARTFQNVEVLGKSSVLENVLLGRHIFIKENLFSCGLYAGRAAHSERIHRERAREIIDFLGLGADEARLVGGMPYGRQKLVEIARALAMEPKLLLLDEPTSGMTPEEKDLVGQAILRIKRELGVTQLLIEHDMAFISHLCERALVLDFGRMIADGAPATVLAMPDVMAAYLGPTEIELA
jgi:branched-chain amino acid transport system ATP-binding protein